MPIIKKNSSCLITRTNRHGFTLIEVLITLSIVGIMASIAYPSYRESIIKGRRADAQGALASFANAMSQWYVENNSSYLGAAGTVDAPEDTGTPHIFAANAPITGETPIYTLSIENATDSTFTLRATPTGVQSGDGFLEINELGEKFWDKNDNGIIDDGLGENGW